MRFQSRYARVFSLLVGVAVASWVATAGEAAETAEFVVVVNAANPATSLSKAQVAALFMKKSTQWPDGLAAVPYDRAGETAARSAFAREVIGKTVAQVAAYWQQQVFSGRSVPPTAFDNEREILDAVRAKTGAVAYVPAGTTLGPGVKVLRIEQ